MPFIAFHKQNLGSGATYDPLDGWNYERLPMSPSGRWLVEMNFNASAIASANVTVTSGSDTLAEDQIVGGGGTDGVIPDTDKPLLVDEAITGDKIKIHFRETAAAGTVDIQGWCRVTPL